MLDVADVINHHDIELVESPKQLLEFEISFPCEQLLNELERGCEENSVASLNQLMPDGAQQMCFASSRKAECENVLCSSNEFAREETVDLAANLLRQPFLVEGCEGLLARKLRSSLISVDASSLPFGQLVLRQRTKVVGMGPPAPSDRCRSRLELPR